MESSSQTIPPSSSIFSFGFRSTCSLIDIGAYTLLERHTMESYSHHTPVVIEEVRLISAVPDFSNPTRSFGIKKHESFLS